MIKNENIIYYEDIGIVRYVNNRRAKNLSIRINQQGEVRLTIPRYVSRKKAELFFLSKKQWIIGKLHEINQLENVGQKLKEGDMLNVRGKQIPIMLNKDGDNVEDAIWRILLKEGRTYLPLRVTKLAALYDFKVSGVKIRKMKTRWGSCTAKNGINLNSWLMMLPDHLVDYIILHELVHTIHRDHSRKFWEALDRITEGNSKILRKEIRSQRIMLINPENQFGGKIN